MRMLFQCFFKQIQKKGLVIAAGIDVVQRIAVLGALLGAVAYGIMKIQGGSLTAGNFVTIYFLVV